MTIREFAKRVRWGNVILALMFPTLGGYVGLRIFYAGAIAHAEGRVAVTTLPDGSKVVTTVKEKP